jgi:hypothetical protein
VSSSHWYRDRETSDCITPQRRPRGGEQFPLAASPTAATTDVEDVDGRPPGGCCRDFRQQPPPELKASMAGPLVSMAI